MNQLPNQSTSSGRIKNFFLNNRNIAICILLNTVVIFLLSFHRFQHVLLPLDVVFTIFFILEMIVKISHYRKSFFKDKENIFDLLIVVISSIPLFGLYSLDWIQVMRLTRIFKSLRLFELIPNYKKLLINFKLVLRSCIGILVGLSIMIFLLSIILSSLYGTMVPEYFGNPLESIYSVFRLFSIEGWYDIPDAIAQHSSYVMGYISKFFLAGIVLVFGIFGMGFVSSVFIDEVTSDNNDEVLRELKELKEIIKTIQNGKDETRI